MKLSRNGANLIKAFEGCHKAINKDRTVFRAYKDPIGIPTIGWGHTNHHGRKFSLASTWSKAECDEEFLKDMVRFENAVDRLVTVNLNQHQFDALVSFTYNCGEGNLGKSTLLKKVNRRDWDGAAREFAKWNRAAGKVFPGLTRRRASEALLFQGITDNNYDGRPDKGKPKPDPIEEPDVEGADEAPPDKPRVDDPGDTSEPMPQAVDPPPKPKPTGVSEGAIGVGGLSIAGIFAKIWEQLKDTPDTLMQAIIAASASPSFWFIGGALGLSGYILYKRKQAKKDD
jgi:lysozyme